MPNAYEVRVAFLQGVGAYHGPLPSDAVVAEKCAASLRANDPLNYAFTTGRNWALSQERSRAAAVRTQLKLAAKLSAETRRAEHEARMVEELNFLLNVLVTESIENNRVTALKQLGVVRHAFVDREEFYQISQRFPDASRDTIYQWKHRGIALVSTRASTELRAFLKGV